MDRADQRALRAAHRRFRPVRAGAQDKDKISDDGSAGMTYFGDQHGVENLDVLPNRSCPSCCHQQRRFYSKPHKSDTVTTLPGPWDSTRHVVGLEATAPISADRLVTQDGQVGNRLSAAVSPAPVLLSVIRRSPVGHINSTARSHDPEQIAVQRSVR